MPLLNKNNAARSRRSSIESQLNDPAASSATPTSELWTSQGSDVSFYEDMPSPEQQERHVSVKRSSVFKIRARSNTATSTSSFVSFSSAMVRLDTTRSSQDLLDLPGTRRPLFTRRKTGKRRSGQVSPSSQFQEEESADANKRTSVLRKGRKNGNQPGSTFGHLKHRISSPFDFQHLTHTERDQLPALEQASEHDLVRTFSEVRGSQIPHSDLNGIRADYLHFSNFSSENVSSPESRSQSAMGLRSPPLSPQSSYGSRLQPESPLRTHSQQTIRPTRSVESFSQPGIHHRVHRHTQSATPSPRLPFRPPFTAASDLGEETSPTARRVPSRTQSNRESGVWDQFSPLVSPTLDGRLPTIADEAEYFGHAVTTPDNSAIPMSPTYSPELEDVAEEPERFSSPRPAPAPPSRPVHSPRSPLGEAFPHYGTQRTANTRSNSRTSSFSSPRSVIARAPMTRPMSQMSDTLGSAIPPRRHSIRRSPTVRRKSNTWRAIEESWEDDVDYIYENALEADCEFDWDRPSDDGRELEDRDRTPEQQDDARPSTTASHHTQAISAVSEDKPTFHTGIFPGAFRASLLVPCTNNVPELEARSAISASTADTGLQTPSDFFPALDRRPVPYTEGEGFVITPSLLIPPEYKETHDETYNDILADYEGSDRHFAIIDANQSVVSSSRSSHIRSSKRSSYDSSLMSSGQGSGSWSSPVRRSASSSGSLPELVHSRRSRKEFNNAVEQLSEQMASFGTCEEDDIRSDDDDTTPPGRVFSGKTFFSADEEDKASYTLRASVESEVRASLELARRGSSRSTHTPAHGHRYASSDGAAKLLASPLPATPELQPPPKSHARAASSSNGGRGAKRPYLSLFPTPPKHSPLATPTSPLSSKSFPILP